jgi:hypothetical protein
MRIRSLLVAAAALFTLGGSFLSAQPFTDHFGELQAELVQRRDNDFSGTLDSTQKKQQKAVLKSIKLLDKDSTSLGTDLATFTKVGPTLEKAFASEFIAVTAVQNFRSLIVNLASNLGDDVEEARGALHARVGGLSDKGAAKVNALITKIDEALGSVETPLPSKDFGKSRSKANKLVVKGHKLADKDSGGGGGGPSTITLVVDGVPLTGDASTKVEVHNTNNVLVVASAFPTEGYTYYLVIYLEGVTGTGSFPLTSGAQAFVNRVPTVGDGVMFNATSGSLDVTFYDKNSHISGNFNFSATNEGVGPIVIGASVFDIYNIEKY